MDAHRFDALTKALSMARSRRAALRGAAGLLGGLATAGIARLPGAAAAPAPPLPPPSFDEWPVCSETQTHYCVDALVVDGVDQLTEAAPQFWPSVVGTASYQVPAVTSRLEASVYPTDPTGLLGVNDVLLRVRSGRLFPLVTFGAATSLRMTISGDATSGWVVELRGRPGIIPTRDHPNSEQATGSFVAFGATGFDPAGGETQLWGGFEGYMASTANGFGTPQWVRDGWEVSLSSPHLMPDGSITQGSYTAWMTPGALQRLELTPEQAVAGGLTVTRADGGVVSAVNAAISALAGGVLIEIPDLTFSSPTIAIRRRGGGKCPKRCRKGQTCKNGRCVKKGKGKRKGKGKGKGKKKKH